MCLFLFLGTLYIMSVMACMLKLSYLQNSDVAAEDLVKSNCKTYGWTQELLNSWLGPFASMRKSYKCVCLTHRFNLGLFSYLITFSKTSCSCSQLTILMCPQFHGVTGKRSRPIIQSCFFKAQKSCVYRQVGKSCEWKVLGWSSAAPSVQRTISLNGA